MKKLPLKLLVILRHAFRISFSRHIIAALSLYRTLLRLDSIFVCADRASDTEKRVSKDDGNTANFQLKSKAGLSIFNTQATTALQLLIVKKA